MANEGKALLHPDEWPWVGPSGSFADGTLLMNEDSNELYFWNANATPAPKWEPLE